MTTSTEAKKNAPHSPTAELGLLETSTRPAFLWAEAGSRLLWANEAAACFAGHASADDLINASFLNTPFAAQMDTARRSLRPGIQRLELLRMPGKTAPVSFIGRMTLMIANGETALLVIGPENSDGKGPAKIKPQEKNAKAFSPVHGDAAGKSVKKKKPRPKPQQPR